MESNHLKTVNEFADNFNSLLNNPIIKRDEAEEVRSIPLPNSSPNTIVIDDKDITEVISKLKENKSADPSLLVSEHIIYGGCTQLLTWMRNFYNSIFTEQTTPEDLSKSIVHPLVKSYKKSLKSFNNYRGISIIPVFTKILEYIILLKCPNICDSHNLQHGYKKSSSTLHVEFLIRETLHYYNKNHSPLYICSLDAEKAFDSCNWNILFEKLHYKKQIPLSIVNVIKSLYLHSSAKVKYKGMYSEEFRLSQGVRQGSVLSPHLYSIYTEALLTEVQTKMNDCGTTLYEQYTGILMYADDIILMSTTLNGLKKLINQCESVCRKDCINFNYDKTEFCISKNSGYSSNTFLMNGYTVEPSNSLKHLGILWNIKKNILTMDDENINSRISKFWAVVKMLVKEGIRFCHPQTIKQMYMSLTIPTLTYGIELCDLTSNLLNKLDTESRKALKALFNISIYSKNYLHTLLNIESTSTLIIKNKFNLLTRLLRNETSEDIILKMLQTQNSNYSFVTDIQNLSMHLNINIIDIIVSRRCPLVTNYFEPIEEVKYRTLMECLNSWNNLESRKRFINIMEERVVR